MIARNETWGQAIWCEISMRIKTKILYRKMGGDHETDP